MSQGKRIVLASRPVGEPKPSDFRLEECPVPTPGAGEVLLRTIWLSLDPYMRGRMSDGPSYAPAGAGRRRDGRRHGQRGDRLEQSRFRQGRHRAVARRLADACDLRRQGPCQNRSEDRADLDRGRRARHARHDGLHRPARHRQAAGGRDRRRRGGLRRGRLGGRPDREDQGRPRGRHRRRQGQMRLRQERTRLRRLPRSPRSGSGREAEGRLPEGHRRLFRERRRRGVRGGVPAAQRVCAHPGVRPDLANTTISARPARNGPAR